jgi:hypothetical protein
MATQNTSSLPSDQGKPEQTQTLKIPKNVKVTKEYEPNYKLKTIAHEYQPRKTVWDILQLLIIPITLALVGFWFTGQQNMISLQASASQHQSDHNLAVDQQRATILQTYIDNIQDLLLNHNLLKSSSFNPGNPYYDVALLAQARTLTAIQGLDSGRKGILLIFIYEARLIGFIDIAAPANGNIPSDPTFNLFNADLRGVDLSGSILASIYLNRTNLSGANFTDADLTGASLGGANLSGATLRDTNLSGVDLINVNLNRANLSGAYLYKADLSDARLFGANLSGAILDSATITQQQLDQAASCKKAQLPQGLTCHHQSP